jgi:hypothetical protein
MVEDREDRERDEEGSHGLIVSCGIERMVKSPRLRQASAA